MPHLPTAEINGIRQHATQDILQEWNTMQGAEWYVLQCPCHPDCKCMPYNEVPRIVLSQCMYVGELDYFFVEQPFLKTHGFRVWWHCDECESELACGFPLSQFTLEKSMQNVKRILIHTGEVNAKCKK